MLYAIVFTCGASLMGLEIAAARMLAPVLGNSTFVWGSVISVVMIALSCGYWLGGQIADRFDAARVLPIMIGGAGLATAAVPLVAASTLTSAASFGPRLGSLVASALIFFVPALLLATVSPLGIRLVASRGLDRIARSAGGLYAVSTGGSVVGTISTSFWLIPLFELEPLIVWTSMLLCLTALASLLLRSDDSFLSRQPSKDSGASPYRTTRLLTTLLVGISVALGAWILVDIAPPQTHNEFGEKVLFRTDSQYHRISVTEDDSARYLRFDRIRQSAVSLTDEYESALPYTDYLHLALALKPEARDVLVLGLGGGSVSKRYWRDYPEIRVDSVEVDPAVVEVASTYFGLPEDPRFRIFTEDARRFLRSADRTYDIIIVDTFNADSIPYHLTTAEFCAELKSSLNPGGVVAYNIISAIEGPRSGVFRSIYRTTGSVWEHRWIFPVGFSDDGALAANRNIILLATETELPRDVLLQRIRQRVDGRVTVNDFERFGRDLYEGTVVLADVPLLTDSYAPVDSLIKVD